MIASKPSRSGLAASRWPGGATSSTGRVHAVERLLEACDGFRWRAPEVTLVLGERAATLAETIGNAELATRAEGFSVSARVRLGHRADTVARVIAACQRAEESGQFAVASQLRGDLAVCARSVGVPLVGAAALRPVLATPELPEVERAYALAQLVGCLTQIGHGQELNRVLDEADQLLASARELSQEDQRGYRALLRVVAAAHRRRHADIAGAIDAARAGLEFIAPQGGPQSDPQGRREGGREGGREADDGYTRARLVLHLVCALLDQADVEQAKHLAEPMLRTSIRPATVAPLGWLRIAVATRVFRPAGGNDTAAALLREVAHDAERYDLSKLKARAWLELSHCAEQAGDYHDAMDCLYRSQAAEHIVEERRRSAAALLTDEFGVEDEPSTLLNDVLSRFPGRKANALGRTGLPWSTASTKERWQEKLTQRTTDAAAASPITDHSTWPAVEPPSKRDATDFRDGESARSGGRRQRTEGDRDTVSARSVLDRLGISATTSRTSGGRRRATESADEFGGRDSHPRERNSLFELNSDSNPRPETDHWSLHGLPGGRRAAPDIEQPEIDQPDLVDQDRPDPVPDQRWSFPGDNDDWLPKLRLPPPLAPLLDRDRFEPFDPLGDRPWNEPSSNAHNEDIESFGADYADAIAADEPPPDAGLADLLARALAEHKAGTSSAAALVKRLGQQATLGETRATNGHKFEEDWANGT